MGSAGLGLGGRDARKPVDRSERSMAELAGKLIV